MDVSSSEPFASHCQVSFIVQPLSNGIKGYPFFAVLGDGLKEEYLVFRIVIAGEGRGTTFKGKIKDYISDVSSPTYTAQKIRWNEFRIIYDEKSLI
ncbi:MAG: hypothetical protein VYE27_05490 [Pseudomonadota bacterium]|nr:hypothetical protein [Pseudomonadota bacterium]